MVNPVVGVFFHWLGGLASGSFYIPYKGVKKWAWETYWLAGGFFSWIIAPWVMALLLVPDPVSVIRTASAKTLALAYLFGAVWGLGGLTFGLTMRYLGVGLGMAIALGYCAAVGTLTPAFLDHRVHELVTTKSGIVTLIGVFACLAGIAVTGLAGMSKERELSEEQKKSAVAEFDFTKGFLIATFSGIFSAGMAIGFYFAKPIMAETKIQLLSSGRSDIFSNLPVLVVVLLGGFTTNFIWCVILNIKNGTGHEYFSGRATSTGDSLGGGSGGGTAVVAVKTERAPMLSNYLFAALAGTTWYMQFFFYGMGQMRMGKYEFSSWTLHMASIIIFSSLWGIILREWRGSSQHTHRLLRVGLTVLILSTIIVGCGNYLATLK